MTYRAFIVDDEPLARTNLVDALQIHGSWQHIDTFASGKNLIEKVMDKEPDVVFLDIQMPGDNGLELARKLLKLEKPPLVVFVTAFAEYAVTAFELYAIDYLLKPFDDKRMAICIQKLEQALNNQNQYQATLSAQTAWANQAPLEKIIVKSSSSIRIIPTGQVLWLAANGNYVDIHHEEGKHLIRGSLKTLKSYLPQQDFIQIHRSYIVRVSLIREFKSLDEDRATLTLTNQSAFPVGKSFRHELMQLMTRGGN